jgi:predicted CoA-binding protein
LYQGTTLEAAEKLALPEGYGLQAVHNRCVMKPALAAEGRYSSRNRTFPEPVPPCRIKNWRESRVGKQTLRNARVFPSNGSDALYQGTTLEAAEKRASSEGYGLQAVHNRCVMKPALAAEGRYSSRNRTFPQPL